MSNNGYKGAITVYLSIVLSAFILLSGVLIDIVRIRAAEVQIKRAANTAAMSALAGFHTQLKEEYGLFALHNSDGAYLKNEVEFYLMAQLNTKSMSLDRRHSVIAYGGSIYTGDGFKKVSFVDLFNFRLDNVQAIPIYNFTENEITRQQIVEYMKYRAPVQFMDSFMKKLNKTSDAEGAVLVYKQKTALENKLSSIGRSLKRLQESIDILNSFDIKSFESNPASSSVLVELCRNRILEHIYRECKVADFSNLKAPEGIKQAIEIKEKMLHLSKLAEEAANNNKAYLTEQLIAAKRAAEGAFIELEYISASTKQVRQAIDELRSSIEKMKAQSSIDDLEAQEMLKAIQKDIAGYEELLASESSQSLSSDLRGNYEVLASIERSLGELDSWIASEAVQISQSYRSKLEATLSTEVINQSEMEGLIVKLSSKGELRAIGDTIYSYRALKNIIDGAHGSKGKDPRKGTAEAAKNIRKAAEGSALKFKKIEKPELLPSYYINGEYPNKIYSEGIMESESVNSELPVIIKEFDVDFDEGSSFTEEGFDYIADLIKKLKLEAQAMRNEIYVNEYILKVFKDAVEIEGSYTEGEKNSSFFAGNEVEYILCGNSSEEINRYLVKTQLMLIRIAMNTLHVYSDSQKRLQALEIATAAAGVTGFGVPIAHNLIMCAWGTAEAFYDIEQLYNGESVPFIKTKANWRTDLLPSGFDTKTKVQNNEDIMDFDYHDYLRLLLLVENKETKMNRVEDLIQLNIQQGDKDFKLNNSNTYLRLRVQASIKYWFLTGIFVPDKYKTEDGRHLISAELWRGY